MKGCCPSRDPPLGEGEAKRADGATPTNPDPVQTELFWPERLLGFFLGSKGIPFQTPGPALLCKGQDPFPLGSVHSLEARDRRARPGSGRRRSRTRQQGTWCKAWLCPTVLHGPEPIVALSGPFPQVESSAGHGFQGPSVPRCRFI